MQWLCEILDLFLLTSLHRVALVNEINVWNTGGPFKRKRFLVYTEGLFLSCLAYMKKHTLDTFWWPVKGILSIYDNKPTVNTALGRFFVFFFTHMQY